MLMRSEMKPYPSVTYLTASLVIQNNLQGFKKIQALLFLFRANGVTVCQCCCLS